jgi:hypothetical protein
MWSRMHHLMTWLEPPAIDSWMGQNFSSCTRFTPTRCLWAGQTPVIVVPVVHPWNIEHKFIFTQETRLHYAPQSDIIYTICYVRWQLVCLRIYVQQVIGFFIDTKICLQKYVVGILVYCKRISVANVSVFRDKVCVSKWKREQRN